MVACVAIPSLEHHPLFDGSLRKWTRLTLEHPLERFSSRRCRTRSLSIVMNHSGGYRVSRTEVVRRETEHTVARRVLIVDDDPATLQGLSELLEGAGYEAVAVDSFEFALRMLRTAPPDVLITDIRLGAYNGLQLVVNRPVPMPTIVISGYPDPVLQSEAEHFGATYLTKPVSPAAVLELVSEKAPAK